MRIKDHLRDHIAGANRVKHLVMGGLVVAIVLASFGMHVEAHMVSVFTNFLWIYET